MCRHHTQSGEPAVHAYTRNNDNQVERDGDGAASSRPHPHKAGCANVHEHEPVTAPDGPDRRGWTHRELLMLAGASHGPGEHGAVVNVILLVVVMIGVIAGVRALRARKHSAKQSKRERDQGGGA